VLETRDLLLVSTIVQQGGVTAAARRLHLTQSAVSHHLRDLEERLGVQLFVRAHRKMCPTEAGHKLLAVAEQVLPELARGERQVRSLGRSPRRVFRLTISCSTAYHWLPRLLGELEASHPEVELRIVVEAGSGPVEALLDDKLDLAICHPAGSVRGAECSTLFEDEVVGVLSSEHPLSDRDPLLGHDLVGEILLTHVVDKRAQESFVRTLFPDGGPYPTPRVVPSTEAILELARAGQGVGVLPRWALSERACVGLLVRGLGPRGMWRSWVAYHRAAGPVSDLVPTVLSLLRASAQECR
jgi:LysR family transcriptional regulator for metE and metH